MSLSQASTKAEVKRYKFFVDNMEDPMNNI